MSGGDEATIMVKAQYAYTTSEPNELSFTEGALIKVSPRLIFSFSFLFSQSHLSISTGDVPGRQRLVGGRAQRSRRRLPLQSRTASGSATLRQEPTLL
jgi:hypothetical protein